MANTLNQMLKDKEGKINELLSDKSRLENYTVKTLHAVEAKCVPAPPPPRRRRVRAASELRDSRELRQRAVTRAPPSLHTPASRRYLPLPPP